MKLNTNVVLTTSAFLFIVLLILGCVAGNLHYSSDVGKAGAISIPTDLVITANLNGLKKYSATNSVMASLGMPWTVIPFANDLAFKVKKEETIAVLKESVRDDFQKNIFYMDSEDYEIIARLNVKELTLDFRPYPWYYVPIVSVEFPIFGFPNYRVGGRAVIELELQHVSGKSLGFYSAEATTKLKKRGYYYGNKHSNPRSENWVLNVALKEAMEDIKKQVLKDQNSIITAAGGEIEKVETGEAIVMRPSAESKKVEYKPVSQKLKTAAVMDLKAQNVPDFIAEILGDAVRDEMFRSKRYILLNRNDMESLMGEQALSMTGMVDEKSAVEVGRLLSLETMIFGSVSKLGDTYSISLNVVDVQTGKIIPYSVNRIC